MFELHRASSQSNAIEMFSKLGPATRYIAGGTDLMIQLTRKRRSASHVIDISGIKALRGLEVRENKLIVGALVTHKELDLHPEVQKSFPAIRLAAQVVGGHQIRNVGTVGGNLANASPAADMSAALLALGATVHLVGASGRRQVSIDDFFTGSGKSVLEHGELIESVEVPLPNGTSANTFLKAGRRKAMEISLVCVGMKVDVDLAGVVTHARVSLGSVGPTTMRAVGCEEILVGRKLDEETGELAASQASKECTPRSDVRGSEVYRRILVEGLVVKAVARCASSLKKAD